MSVAVQNQKQFVTNYLQLVSLAQDQDHSFFNGVSEYHKIETLGPTLPTLTAPLPSGQTAESVSAVSVGFKSIKPPYKFSSELETPANETIYKLKEKLISSVEVLSSNGISPENLKFLVKGKVIQDTATLASVPNYESGLSFMCMVSKPTPSAEPSQADSQPEDPDAMIEDVSTVSAEAWDKIHSVLRSDLKSDAKADEYLAKMKNSISSI